MRNNTHCSHRFLGQVERTAKIFIKQTEHHYSREVQVFAGIQPLALPDRAQGCGALDSQHGPADLEAKFAPAKNA